MCHVVCTISDYHDVDVDYAGYAINNHVMGKLSVLQSALWTLWRSGITLSPDHITFCW